MKQIKLEILKGNHQEHFKIAKDYALIYPIHHPKRVRIEEELNKLSIEMHELVQEIEKDKETNAIQ